MSNKSKSHAREILRKAVIILIVVLMVAMSVLTMFI